MHEIEDLVEDSIRILHAHHGPDEPRLREWFAVLYGFQDRFDCSFTHFRVMDILVRRRFTYAFPLDRHPDYAQRRDHFDALTEFTALRTFDDDAEEADDFDGYASWLEDGYVDPPLLYCDAGSRLWRRMVDSGRLGGPDAIAPQPVPLIDVVRELAVAAEQHGDRELIATWYSHGCHTLLDGPVGCPYDIEELAEIPAVRDLRAIVRRTRALAVDTPPEHRPPTEASDADDLETWWWTNVSAPGRP
ncbi:hypothetical protein [Embleya scabrispora]|uniref:hypothetical protein n=1 Tax=Embleya scabrispora TaxID=159449 RepID=UPI0003750FA7|nr:hypothetical protein [Embleya scabrispora]